MKEGIGESAVVQRMRSGTIASNSNLNRQAGAEAALPTDSVCSMLSSDRYLEEHDVPSS